MAFGGALVSYGSSTARGRVRSDPAKLDAEKLEKGDLLSIMIERNARMPHDTLVGDAYLVGVEISYTAMR